MKYLNGRSYVEVKDERYMTRPNENIVIRERKETEKLGNSISNTKRNKNYKKPKS